MSTNLNTLIASIVPTSAMVEYLQVLNIPVPTDETSIANLVVRVSGVKTQANVATLMVNLTKGSVNSDQMDEVLAKAFPDSKANGGKRHGKHYLSLARTGKLPGCLYVPAKENGPRAKVTEPDAKVTELEAKVAELEGKIEAALKATSAKDIKKALTGE